MLKLRNWNELFASKGPVRDEDSDGLEVAVIAPDERA